MSKIKRSLTQLFQNEEDVKNWKTECNYYYSYDSMVKGVFFLFFVWFCDIFLAYIVYCYRIKVCYLWILV